MKSRAALSIVMLAGLMLQNSRAQENSVTAGAAASQLVIGSAIAQPFIPFIPLAGAPFVPYIALPFLPSANAPVQPFTNAPVQPFSSAPVQPFTNTPVQPFMNAPVQPFTNAPVQPFTSSPVQPFISPAPFVTSPGMAAPQTPPLR